MTSATPQSFSRAPLQWRLADSDVSVATLSGEYAGFVSTTTRGFEAQGALGQRLGVFDSIDLAHVAVSRSAAAQPVAAQPADPARTPKSASIKAAAHAAPPRGPRHAHASRRESECRPLVAAPLAHLRQRQR